MRKSFTYKGKRHFIRAETSIEWEIKKALMIRDLDQEVTIESGMLFKDWATEWMQTYKNGSCNEKTYKDYQRRLDMYILPVIGNMRLKDIKQIHLQKIMQNVSHLSQSRIDKIHQCINQVFNAAENNDLITKSPARGLVKPKGYAGTHRAITDYERLIILQVAETHKHGLWVLIMLYCGLRTGETARIKILHFDFEKQLLFIDGTKTGNAKRSVPVPEIILKKVAALKKDPFEYLFTNESGVPIKPHNRGRMWKSFKTAMHEAMGGELYYGAIKEPCKVAPDLVPYCLRHTFCTDLQDAGVPINIARDLMGHSDISLTSKIYTHTTDRAIQDAAKLLKEYRKVAR